jgi:hypothetical protein
LFSDQFRRGESDKGLVKGAKSSKLVSNLSDIAWKAFQSVNTRLPEGEAIRPKWAPGPLLKSYERTSPPLGFPRETDSLCPRCVKEVRDAVISGETTLESLMNEHPGEIKAQIVEENGQVVMRKTCPKHGEFVDVMATIRLFSSALNRSFSAATLRAAEDACASPRNLEYQIRAARY